jgi:4-hydroxy-2-oxoheptanedioate aldolase
MRTNTLRTVMDSGGPAVCGWIAGDGVYLAEVLSHCGYDTVCVDVQHGMFGMERAIALVQAIGAGPAVPMARVTALDAAVIGKLLDAGAYGIICPAVDTAAQAEALVDACRYPPAGLRSFGPARALLYGGADYAQHADATVLAWAMIESATALENLDAILAVPGIDGVYVGPNDLALSLGEQPGRLRPPPATLAALRRVAEAFSLDAAMAAELAGIGYHLVTPGNDVGIVRQAVAERIAAVRGSATAGAEPGY